MNEGTFRKFVFIPNNLSRLHIKYIYFFLVTMPYGVVDRTLQMSVGQNGPRQNNLKQYRPERYGFGLFGPECKPGQNFSTLLTLCQRCR